MFIMLSVIAKINTSTKSQAQAIHKPIRGCERQF